ncbi:translation initiation factor IF-2-like [Oenanthe melanoleuca]|uniref:translation initiation factor IF-2-like n=1 Tax=Oenanthe melanoleuca TaxID=2939378 RepID=UPI0024C10C71|nr:translation initiation factor IF-2-like [Oenanthe melanoleuca]
MKEKKKTLWIFFSPSASPSPPPLDVASCLACGVTVMKKCFRAPGRVIFLCNESGFCQRKEPARSEDRRAVSFQERGPARREAPCARDPRSLRALIRSHSRLAGAPPRALTSGELRSPSAPPLRAARPRGAARPRDVPAEAAGAAAAPRPLPRAAGAAPCAGMGRLRGGRAPGRAGAAAERRPGSGGAAGPRIAGSAAPGSSRRGPAPTCRRPRRGRAGRGAGPAAPRWEGAVRGRAGTLGSHRCRSPRSRSPRCPPQLPSRCLRVPSAATFARHK